MKQGTLRELEQLVSLWPDQEETWPVFFVGHGAPTYALGDNVFAQRWREMGAELPRPRAIVCISAHWLTRGTHVTAMEHPRTIHDFGRFDDRLFEMQYPAPGEPDLAELIAKQVQMGDILLDHRWGLDHGTWCVLFHMFPEANIPVIQLSIDYAKPASFHYELGKQLRFLRKKGVFVVCSGNIVHNLRMFSFDDAPAYDWAIEFDRKVAELLEKGDHQSLVDYEKLGKSALYSVPTPDHYYPLLYALGLQDERDQVTYPITGLDMRSISMRSVFFQG